MAEDREYAAREVHRKVYRDLYKNYSDDQSYYPAIALFLLSIGRLTVWRIGLTVAVGSLRIALLIGLITIAVILRLRRRWCDIGGIVPA